MYLKFIFMYVDFLPICGSIKLCRRFLYIKVIGFSFFSNEGNPLEPCHVHVRKGESLAKFWVGETVSLADNIGFSAKELSDLCKVANENKDKIK